MKIYIPIWLDLLYYIILADFHNRKYLHSNMVRFIINLKKKQQEEITKFTFQYG